MKTETTTQPANSSPVKMAFDIYPSISSGKQQDPVREVVMKYIDYFLQDASGTSAVAIDNKIEQAMDLVKSHLMITVREEVEVLKEKISELVDRNNQLEVENSILKANIPQETLQKLQMQTQLQISGSTPTNGSNMITGTPTQAAIASAPQATGAPISAAANAVVANAAINANSNSSTAAATPQSNVGSGTATPTTQQPSAAAVEQNIETTQLANIVNTEDSSQEGPVQATNGPMS